MFKDLGIKGRVLLLTLLPTSLLAMVLGGYFTWVQLSDMRAQLIERGQLIAEQLAPLAATALARKDTAVLNRIANEALDQPDVRAVTFLDARQERLAHAGPSMLTVAPAGDASHLSMSTELDTTHFLLPVLGRHHSLSGATEPDDERVLGWVELELSHHGTLLRGYRSLFTSLLLIAAGLGVTALLALRMSRAINAPLELISQGVAQLKEGRMETRLPPMGSNELDELASGINRMAETLQSAQEEMQHNIDQATEDVRQNLETIEIQNIELDLARKEALEASRIKSEFLANMSHEIRTPLNGILGFTNLLQKSELSPRQQDYLTTIQKSAESLLGIINEILDFSKIEAGKLVLENLPFNLRDLIQDALTMLAPAAHEKQLELVSLVYRDTPIQLQGDPQRLKQILTNLVGNAIKFTQGGTVAVRAMLEDESDDRAQLRISVQDTGIGLSEEDQQALFKAFSQADNSLSRQAGGTGLGLVISKRLIEQMGGEIGVDSTPGEGAEFWISLSLPKSRDDNEEPGASWAAGQRVALLEPQELTRRSLHHQLTDFGLEVSEFADLDSLQESLRNPPPGQLPISLAVLGVSAAIHPPEELSQSFWEFERLGCKTLVLCPTTEQAQYHATLPDEQVEAKPACTRKLQRKLQELLQVRPTRSDKPHAMVSGRPPRLLCVDDNPANLLLVQTLLSDLGAQVTAVDSGYAALEVVQRERFDLVFMDVQMPGMDGRQATEAIRRWEAEREVSPVPVIALTAHALSNEKRALLQAGMDDYLTKPIDEQQLAQVVLKWTGLSLGQSLASMSRAPQLGQLSVLDPEEGLRLAAGKADLAADMLAMLLASERYPLYLPLTVRSLARSLGIQPTPTQRELLQQQSDLHYPLRPLEISAPANPLNIVWIVAESLRGDMLDPRYMPRLWDFSNRAIRLDNHYSSGNLTQMGVFGMFYGLHGGYWDAVLKAGQPPVLMEVLRQQNYQFRINAAQRFSYPPFDRSVFVNLRPQDLHVLDSPEPAWQRDARNTDDLLRFVDRRLPDRPFFACLFLESSHANYSFRDETAKIRPYLVNFNYLTTDFQAQMPLIKNRYLNAVREVDTQIGRLLQHLENQHLLENTAVVVLGDHGEEFMERSRWGHNTEFNRYQTGTVAVLSIPGQAPRAVRSITSHIDLPATLLPLLGVRNPPRDYSLGQDLLAADYHRDYAVSADTTRIAYLGEGFKVSFPLRGADRHHGPVSDGDDRPLDVEQQEAIRGPLRAARLELLQDLGRFSALPVGEEPSPRSLATSLTP